MIASNLRLAALLPAVWCASVQAAGDEGIALRLERALSETVAAQSDGRPAYGFGARVEGRTEREVTLRGNAEIRKGGTVVRAERLTYYAQDDELVGVGQVRVTRQGNVFTGPELRLKIDANEGVFTAPSYLLPLYRGSGKAAELEFLGPERLALRDATFTTCRPEDPDWHLRARSIEIDQGKHEGVGRSAELYFKDRKIVGLPRFGFPLGDERRSGFLAPGFAFTTRTGPEFVVPYYWNIAPNRDLTLYPRFMQRRGLQLGGHFRDLEPTSVSDVRFELTPVDSLTNTSRSFWSVNHAYTDIAGWGGVLNMRGVSDDNYFVDFSRSILASADRVLPREVSAVRGFGDWTVMMRATTYQNILDARLAPPYERVPQLNALWSRRDVGGFDAESMFDATRFRRPLLDTAEGARLVAFPKLSYPILRPGWFFVPKLGLHMSSYSLDTNGAYPTTLNRTVPILSVDSGLVFERSTRVLGREVTQTLEPRLFYARSPYRDQSAFPVFDTAVADFSFAQLFSDNTFVGNDRVADVNQLTTAVVSRLIEPATGAESLRLAFGQRQYFSDQRVAIPGSAPRTDKRSDLLFAASASLDRANSLDAGLQYSMRDSLIPRLNLMWRHLPGDGRILNAGVRYLRNELGQLDASARWPLAAQWTALGRMNYSWLTERVDPATGSLVDAKPGIIEGVLGVEYLQDCWVSRFVMHRFVTAAGRSTSALFLQVELTGLGRVGSDPFDILRRNIPGYRLPTDRPAQPSRFFGYE